MTPDTTPLIRPASPLIPSIAIVPKAPDLPAAPPVAARTAEAPTIGAAIPALVLFGRDDRGRPHASRFAAVDAEAAGRAAGLMGLHAFGVTEEHRPLAAGLPPGRLFESGKAFVPFCTGKAFTALLAAAGLPDTPPPVRAAGKAADKPTEARPPAGAGAGGGGGPDRSDGAAKRPADWSGIGIGSVVLACQGPQQGWWEATVILTKADDHFVLQWRDFPADGEITRARKDLGLMPPDSREGLG